MSFILRVLLQEVYSHIYVYIAHTYVYNCTCTCTCHQKSITYMYMKYNVGQHALTYSTALYFECVQEWLQVLLPCPWESVCGTIHHEWPKSIVLKVLHSGLGT